MENIWGEVLDYQKSNVTNKRQHGQSDKVSWNVKNVSLIKVLWKQEVGALRNKNKTKLSISELVRIEVLGPTGLGHQEAGHWSCPGSRSKVEKVPRGV